MARDNKILNNSSVGATSEENSIVEMTRITSIHTSQFGIQHNSNEIQDDLVEQLFRRLSSTDSSIGNESISLLPIKHQQHSARVEQILIRRLLPIFLTKRKKAIATLRKNPHNIIDRDTSYDIKKDNDRSLHYRKVMQKIRKQHLNMKWLTKVEYMVLSVCDSSNWLENSVNGCV